MILETGAVAKLRELVAEEGNPNLMLRVCLCKVADARA